MSKRTAPRTEEAVPPTWSPPALHSVQPTGAAWDAVQAPAYLGDRALARLGDATGAVIRDPYRHRLYWLLPPGSTTGWKPLAQISTYGPACWIEVPPADRTKGLGPYWAVAPGPGRLLTNADLLHEALSVVTLAALGPREEATR